MGIYNYRADFGKVLGPKSIETNLNSNNKKQKRTLENKIGSDKNLNNKKGKFVEKKINNTISKTEYVSKIDNKKCQTKSYINITSLDFFCNENNKNLTIKTIVDALKKMLVGTKKILIVGIGNRGMTSDSLGPKVIEKLIEKQIVLEEKAKKQVFLIAPNVVANTGIESFDMVFAVKKEINPDLILVVDSLCTKNIERIGVSFQITNDAIVPGSGIKNKKNELSQKSLGVGVLAIGVPMVIYLKNAFMSFINGNNSENFNVGNKMEVKQGEKALLDDMVVTIKEIDILVESCAEIISSAIIDTLL